MRRAGRRSLPGGELALNGGTPVRKKPYREPYRWGAEAKELVEQVLDSGILSAWYGGPVTRAFERLFAAHFEVPYAVAVNSGTSAIHVACVAAGLAYGDEVLVPGFCYVSGVSAVLLSNAVPVFVDVDPQTWLMDIDDLECWITPRTRAILPVHLYGQSVDMDGLCAVASKHDLCVIEDAAQAHGAMVRGKKVGTFGTAGCFSLGTVKLVSCGAGGVLVSSDSAVHRIAIQLIHKGKDEFDRDGYYRMGFGYQLPELLSAAAIVSLRHLPEEIARRRKNLSLYRQAFPDTGLALPSERTGVMNAAFKCPLLLPEELAHDRALFVKAVSAENINMICGYPLTYRLPWLRDEIAVRLRAASRTSAANAQEELLPGCERVARATVELRTSITQIEAEQTCDAVLKV